MLEKEVNIPGRLLVALFFTWISLVLSSLHSFFVSKAFLDEQRHHVCEGPRYMGHALQVR